MPEARERKENDKIKGKGGIKSSTKKSDVRRQMTAKFRKELVERQRGRDAGGNTDTAPEVQAAEQIEEKIYTTADSIREHTSDAVTKSVSRHRRKEQKKKRRTESVSSEPPTADAEPAPPPARENIRQKAPDDMRTRTAEVRRDPAYPLREYRPNKIRERPTEPHPDRMRTPKGTRRPAAKQTREFSPSERKSGNSIEKAEKGQFAPKRDTHPCSRLRTNQSHPIADRNISRLNRKSVCGRRSLLTHNAILAGVTRLNPFSPFRMLICLQCPKALLNRTLLRLSINLSILSKSAQGALFR